MSFDLDALAPLLTTASGALLGAVTSLLVRIYGSDQRHAGKLLAEIVGRLETSQSEALARVSILESRLRELEREQSRSGAQQAAFEGRLLELRTDFRATSEKLDTISQLLAAIRSQLESLTVPPARRRD